MGILEGNDIASPDWNVSQLVNPIRYECLWDHHRYRVSVLKPPLEHVSARSNADAVPLDYVGTVYSWNGEAFCVSNASARSLAIRARPKFGISKDFLGPFNGVDWPVFAARKGLLLAFQNGVHVSDVDNDLTLNTHDSVIMEIVYSKEHQAISGIDITLRKDAGGGDSQAISTVRYRACDWRQLDGHWIAWKAVRELRIHSRKSDDGSEDGPFIQRIGYVRETFVPDKDDRSDDLSCFDPPPAVPGTRVTDARQQIAYIIGNKTIVADGTMFVLPASIDHLLSPEDTEVLLMGGNTALI